MPTKRLTQGLVNKFNILTGAKYLSSGIFQIIHYLYQLKNTLKFQWYWFMEI